MHKLHWDFEIQTEHLISTRRPDLVIINKKKKKKKRICRIVNLAVQVDYRVKLKEIEKKDKYPDFAWELEKKKQKQIVEHESDGHTNCRWCSWYSHQRIVTMAGRLGNKRTCGDNPNNRTVERPSANADVKNSHWVSLRVFGLLFSSLLLFPQRFGRYVLRPSFGVCRTREPSRNFELRPLLNPRGSPVLIPLAITGYKC